MAMERSKHRRTPVSRVTPLRAVEHPNAFGAHIKMVREREKVAQQDITQALQEYFDEYNVTFPTNDPNDMYRKVEKGIRAVQYEELIPLYATLVGCEVKQSAEERHKFVRLARAKLESLQRKRPKLRSNSEWDWLEAQLAKIDQQKPKNLRQTVFDVALNDASLDISHVVGREEWLEKALSYLETDHPKKLVVVQGIMGAGKSTCLKLLLLALEARAGYQPFLHFFSERKDMTSEDHLDNFLATILAKLEVIIPEVKIPSRQEQVQLLLNHLTNSQVRIILLLDDAQVILDERGQLPAIWQHFITEFLKRNHQATVYLATREWSMWLGRDSTYIVDGDDAMLPQLSSQAGVHIWKRLGIDDVSNELLERATSRFGGNPRMIELRATNLQRPRYMYTWPTYTDRGGKSAHQQAIEDLLEEPNIFGTLDVEARYLLEQAISTHLSSEAREMLDILSFSPVPLPFPLLLEIKLTNVEYSFVELLDASLIDRQVMATNQRAAVAPLASEARKQQALKEGRQDAVEQFVAHLYQTWLEQGLFKDEQEQASLITELALLYLRQQQLLQAAELLAEYSWLINAFGHIPRLARIVSNILNSPKKSSGIVNEIGSNLLHQHLTPFQGEKISEKERADICQHIQNLAKLHGVALVPATEIYLLQHRVIYLAKQDQFTDAQQLVDNSLERVEPLRTTDPFTYASSLYYRAYLSVKKYEFEEKHHNTELSLHHLQEAIENYQQCIDLLRESKHWASHAKTSTIIYKLARRLNDYAYYANKLSQCTQNKELREGALSSLKESIDLKRAGYAYPGSIAVGLGEYAQFIAEEGKIQEALSYNNLALQDVENLITTNQPNARRERAVHQVDRGHLLLLLGWLSEAEQLFTEALPHLRNTTRNMYAIKADQDLQTIREWRAANGREQLDWRWSKRFEEIANYDTFAWLAPSGPLTDEEKGQLHKHDQDSLTLIAQLKADSRDRELAQAIAERRNPDLYYPGIPIDEVKERIKLCRRLRDDIQDQEHNVRLRDLYLQTLHEQYHSLCMIQSTWLGNSNTFVAHNRALHPEPSALEMDIAIQQLIKILKKGMYYTETAQISIKLFQHLQEIQLIPPQHNLEREAEQELAPELQETIVNKETMFSAKTVVRFYNAILMNHFPGWRAIIDAGALNARVEPQIQAVILPNRDISIKKISHLNSHELDSHTLRFANGQLSRIALLGLGTAGYLPTEEGLALYNDNIAAKTQDKEAEETIPWVGTIAVGLCCGAKRLAGGSIPAHSFYDLYYFMREYHLLDQLLMKKSRDMAEKEAERQARARCLRTWRGAPTPYMPSSCSTKDHCYLLGYLSLKQAIQERGESILTALEVGAVAIDQLDTLAELSITQPVIKHKPLSQIMNLEQLIRSFEFNIESTQ